MLLSERFTPSDPVLMDVGFERPMVADLQDALRLITLRMSYRVHRVMNCRTGINIQRLIVKGEKGEDIHHRDKDVLNNQRYNLEAMSHSCHSQRHKIKNEVIGVKERRNGKYTVEISGGNKRIYLGTFETKEGAGLIYDWAARILYGPKAKVNFPDVILSSAAAFMIWTSGGKFFDVGFRKRTTGEFRQLSCRIVSPPGPFYGARYNLIIVRGKGLDGFRAIPVEGIETLCINGNKYKVVR